MITGVGFVYTMVEVADVVDGDTLDLRLTRDIGFYFTATAFVRCRLLGCDTPERGKAGWTEATEFTRNWCESRAGRIEAVTYKADHPVPLPDGGFGRWLVNLLDGDVLEDGESLSDLLLDTGHAVPYERKS